MTIPPAPGSICQVRPHRAGPLPALVLVVAHLGGGLAQVRLLTNEVEFASDAEHLVPPAPARPYALLVHEFPAYVRTADLDPALSVLDPARDLHPTGAPALTCRHDPRWGWKLAELGRIRALQPPLDEVLAIPL